MSNNPNEIACYKEKCMVCGIRFFGQKDSPMCKPCYVESRRKWGALHIEAQQKMMIAMINKGIREGVLPDYNER